MLDGLDEIEECEKRELVDSLQMLLSSQVTIVELYCATRPDTNHYLESKLNPKWRIPMASEAISADINRFIEAMLEQHLEDGELKLGNPELILVIRDTLTEGAQGLFVIYSFTPECLALKLAGSYG